VVEGAAGDPYAHLIAASEGSIRMVMIGGTRRLAVQELSAGMLGIEAFKVEGKTINLNLHDATADPLVEGLKLSTAIDRLTTGLKNIKSLATAQEHPQRAVAGMPLALAAAVKQPAVWRLVLDHEEPAGESIRPRFTAEVEKAPIMRLSAVEAAAAAPPLSQILEPLELDAITVVDDASYLLRLREQTNLPKELTAQL